MGVSIDMHIYDYFDLVKNITRQAEEGGIPEGRSVNEFVEKVLPEFGFRAGDKYITLWNEYYEDYNSGSELMQAASLYFGLDDCWLGGYDYGGSANAREVLSDLNIEPLGDDEDDYY